MIKLLSKEIRKYTILHLSHQANFVLKQNSHLYCSISFLSLQKQPRNTTGHCLICSYAGTHRTEVTTHKFAQVPFPHLQDMALASEGLTRYCNCYGGRKCFPQKDGEEWE